MFTIGKTHTLLKKGRRCYLVDKEVSLGETRGNGDIFMIIEGINIEFTHFIKEGDVWISWLYNIADINMYIVIWLNVEI